MTTESITARDRDPVCGMNVRVEVALEEGLTVDHDGHRYHFCRPACRDAFVAAPAHYVTTHAHRPEPTATGAPVIDEGMRRWYDSCACCLSDAYPEVKATLDAERAAQAQPTADPGICEVAEAAETSAEPAGVSEAR